MKVASWGAAGRSAAANPPHRYDGGMRGRFRRVLTLATGAAIVVMLVAHVAIDAGPLHAASCIIDGRGGWFVEYPPGLETPADVEAVIREETTCVPIEILHVDWNEVPDGLLAIEMCCRDGFAHGDTLLLWVEGTPEQAADPCSPPTRDAPRRVGCPGGAQLAPQG